MSRAGDGIRTRDVQLGKLAASSSKRLSQNNLEPANDPRCTAGCTNPAENAHEAAESVGGPLEDERLELSAADSDLQAVIDAWSGLPDAVQAGILAMVRLCGVPESRE
ncbi:hypothetical protein NG895_18735 [Aeoliella sp. ICT_H6.2]|uniref:Uncharacterized protein n=1 Tax=Aeoliella straminimaris TaxID=2954799 RepID=A0A9X2JHL3_9BACT|nr:hypothetical protein [Aeoliella straminimaris]MCO6045941.1 hypothetical protein [Aeoliella straminimaris]